MRMQYPVWSNKALRRLGEALRDDSTEAGKYPEYSDVLAWYLELCVDVQSRIEQLDWEPLGLVPVEITSRPKSIDTLKDKLRRDRSTPLSSIGDIAGVRFEAEMTLSVQTALAESMAEVFASEVTHGGVHMKDLRATPHSGYRAVHLVVAFPAGRCEIQIRTDLQGAWANMYEQLGDLYGRDIRYGSLPERSDEAEVVRLAHHLSRSIAEIEAEADAADPAPRGYPHTQAGILTGVKDLQDKLDQMKGQ
jgi:ppGpp synthetase/RelA/SpoT-type nucleotidyltranferase